MNGGDDELGGVDRGDDSWTEFLTTIVSRFGALDLVEGVFAEEFLPDLDSFICDPKEEGCEVGSLSRSAGSGDRSGGRLLGFSGWDFEACFVSLDFETWPGFLGRGEA